jgi:hypothetical protein
MFTFLYQCYLELIFFLKIFGNFFIYLFVNTETILFYFFYFYYIHLLFYFLDERVFRFQFSSIFWNLYSFNFDNMQNIFLRFRLNIEYIYKYEYNKNLFQIRKLFFFKNSISFNNVEVKNFVYTYKSDRI